MARSITTSLERRFAARLHNSEEPAAGDSLGVAVSGGADSVALLRLLISLQSRLGVTLRVLHFHHSLRGPEADADAEFVKDLAAAHNLEFIFERQDVALAAKENRWNLEDAARRLRYTFFERVISSCRVSRVAVAHTADDQAETVLAHILRGTGPRGLGGIHPVAGCVFRPLLEFRRLELRRYLESQGQPWREDASNLDTHRLRARIRAQLLPVLETGFSPQIVAHLGTLARLSREEESFWDGVVEISFRASVRSTAEGLLIQAKDLLAPPPLASLLRGPRIVGPRKVRPAPFPLRPLTERLVRRLYAEVRGERSAPSAIHVEQVIALAKSSSSGRLQLPGKVEVERCFADLYFRVAKQVIGRKAHAAAKPGTQTCAYQYAVALPGRGETVVSVPEIGTCFRLKVIDWPLTERETKSDGVAFDADLLRAPLILRNWRPGDAFRPCGRRQSRKLKNLFLASRVPVRQRSEWPVLESAGNVIWARGFPPAAEFAACPKTRSGVVIEESRL